MNEELIICKRTIHELEKSNEEMKRTIQNLESEKKEALTYKKKSEDICKRLNFLINQGNGCQGQNQPNDWVSIEAWVMELASMCTNT